MAVASEPPDGDHEYVYGVVPPVATTVADPFDPDLHDTFVDAVMLADNATAGSVIVTEIVAVEFNESVTVTV